MVSCCTVVVTAVAPAFFPSENWSRSSQAVPVLKPSPWAAGVRPAVAVHMPVADAEAQAKIFLNRLLR